MKKCHSQKTCVHVEIYFLLHILEQKPMWWHWCISMILSIFFSSPYLVFACQGYGVSASLSSSSRHRHHHRCGFNQFSILPWCQPLRINTRFLSYISNDAIIGYENFTTTDLHFSTMKLYMKKAQLLRSSNQGLYVGYENFTTLILIS